MMAFLSALIMTVALQGEVNNENAETIVFHHRPGGLCLDGTSSYCAGYTITLQPTGRVNYSSISRGAVRAVDLTVSSAEMKAYRSRLAPYRHPGERFSCYPSVTDGDGIEVSWQQGDRFVASVSLNGGCRFDGGDRMWQALNSAPALLSGVSSLLPH